MKITFDPVNALKRVFEKNSYSSVFVLTDKNTHHLCLPLIESAFSPPAPISLTVSDGEITKNIDTCIYLWNELNKKGADRHSVLINLGGGMITDLGGFVASTFKRGIEFINVPTSMLGMVDASIGGKNGINLGGHKNQVGTIRAAGEIIVHAGFLRSLDRRNYLSGYAETLKHGLIGGEAAFERALNFAEPNYNADSFYQFLEENIRLKEKIVAADPFEKAGRKALNAGHTIGHAIEAYSHKKGAPLLHGEAVAWGLLAELWIANQTLAFPDDLLEDILHAVLPIYTKPGFAGSDIPQLLEYMKHDKKNYQGAIRFTLLSEPGKYHIDQAIEKPAIIESLQFIRSLCQQ